jgi:hypothetical protein
VSNETTPLAGGTINGTDDSISVDLVRRANIPAAERTLRGDRAVVAITWPGAPTVVSPTKYHEIAAFLTKLFAESSIALAALKASRQL